MLMPEVDLRNVDGVTEVSLAVVSQVVMDKATGSTEDAVARYKST